MEKNWGDTPSATLNLYQILRALETQNHLIYMQVLRFRFGIDLLYFSYRMLDNYHFLCKALLFLINPLCYNFSLIGCR